MAWVFATVALGFIGFLLWRRKKQVRSLDPRLAIKRLTRLSPVSASLTFRESTEEGGAEHNLGEVLFLQRNGKPYQKDNAVYVTPPENLKIGGSSAQQLRGKVVALQFLHRGIPRVLRCRVLRLVRLPAEVKEVLDFKATSALLLLPVSRVTKEDRRHFFRYAVKSGSTKKLPLTSYVTFDVYLSRTNKTFLSEEAPPSEIHDLEVLPFSAPRSAPAFSTRETIRQFRRFMLHKPRSQRCVHLIKVTEAETRSRTRRSGRFTGSRDGFAPLGDAEVLGLETESPHDVIHLRKPPRLDTREQNQHGLLPRETVLVHFAHRHRYYEMPCEVVESRAQTKLVRPLRPVTKETGLKVELVDYSGGGALIESSPELLRLLLGARCPAGAEEEDYRGEDWEQAFEELRRPMVHLAFYPRFRLPESLRRFEPELPFKISVLAQLGRTHVPDQPSQQVLRHGMKFVYDPQGYGDTLSWVLRGRGRDNRYFTEIHRKLGQLRGYLKRRSAETGEGEGR